MAAKSQHVARWRSLDVAVRRHVYLSVRWCFNIAVRRPIHISIWWHVHRAVRWPFHFTVRRLVHITVWRFVNLTVRRSLHFTVRRLVHFSRRWNVYILRERLQEQHPTMAILRSRARVKGVSSPSKLDPTIPTSVFMARELLLVTNDAGRCLTIRSTGPIAACG